MPGRVIFTHGPAGRDLGVTGAGGPWAASLAPKPLVMPVGFYVDVRVGTKRSSSSRLASVEAQPVCSSRSIIAVGGLGRIVSDFDMVCDP
jgi:hypothetical protein